MAKSKNNTGRSLVIVESPTKINTLKKIIGKNFVIKASVGHLKDLPKKKLGVVIQDCFDIAGGAALLCQAEPTEDLLIHAREIEAVRDIQVRIQGSRVHGRVGTEHE